MELADWIWMKVCLRQSHSIVLKVEQTLNAKFFDQIMLILIKIMYPSRFIEIYTCCTQFLSYYDYKLYFHFSKIFPRIFQSNNFNNYKIDPELQNHIYDYL